LKKTAMILWLAATAVLAGCGSATRPPAWTAQPAAQGVIRPDYRIEFRPVKAGKDFYAAFIVDITNTGGKTLTVNWQASRYLHDGKPRGRFMFAGLTPDAIRGALPPDTIPPAERLEKEIWPIQLVAMAPYRESGVKAADSGFSKGVIPPGENGIRLVLKIGAKTVTETLSVRIRSNR